MTVEDYLRQHIGNLILELSACQAQRDALQEELKKLTPKRAKEKK